MERKAAFWKDPYDLRPYEQTRRASGANCDQPSGDRELVARRLPALRRPPDDLPIRLRVPVVERPSDDDPAAVVIVRFTHERRGSAHRRVPLVAGPQGEIGRAHV